MNGGPTASPLAGTPREPTLFISHKHSDRRIADVVREFLDKSTNREVQVYQSSSSDADGPALGRVLSAELKDALWKTGVVLLIYTSEDQDWQWCMWECGVATNPQSPDTRIIVLQCSADVPRVFQDQVRVNVREPEDIQKFAQALLTSPTFFPGLGKALAPKLNPTGKEVRGAADGLRKSISEVLPKDPVAEWSAQPTMQLQLDQNTADRLAMESKGGIGPTIEIADFAGVSSMDQQAKQIFGIAELAPGTKLSGLAMRWADAVPGESLEWVKDIESQLRRASRGEIPVLRWGYVREVGGHSRYAPLLSRVRRIPALQALQFDVNLLPYDDLMATHVTARMIPVSEMVCHQVDLVPLAELKVRDLAQRLRLERLTRMPFLDEAGRILMIVHRSMVDHYIANKFTDGMSAHQIEALAMSDLMADDTELSQLFTTSFGTIARTTRLLDAKAIMATNHQVQDVFVTPTGGREEPVLGWITNAMIAQASG